MVNTYIMLAKCQALFKHFTYINSFNPHNYEIRDLLSPILDRKPQAQRLKYSFSCFRRASILFSFSFFGYAGCLAGSQFPNQGLNPGPRQ